MATGEWRSSPSRIILDGWSNTTFRVYLCNLKMRDETLTRVCHHHPERIFTPRKSRHGAPYRNLYTTTLPLPPHSPPASAPVRLPYNDASTRHIQLENCKASLTQSTTKATHNTEYNHIPRLRLALSHSLKTECSSMAAADGHAGQAQTCRLRPNDDQIRRPSGSLALVRSTKRAKAAVRGREVDGLRTACGVSNGVGGSHAGRLAE